MDECRLSSRQTAEGPCGGFGKAFLFIQNDPTVVKFLISLAAFAKKHPHFICKNFFPFRFLNCSENRLGCFSVASMGIHARCMAKGLAALYCY